MFTKLIEWWNKKEDRDSEAARDFVEFRHEQEWKFETTLVEDLDAIADLMGRVFPDYILKSEINISRSKNLACFYSAGYSPKQIQQLIPLKSLEITEEYVTIQTYKWRADACEFNSLYSSNYKEYAKTIRTLKGLVVYNYNNTAYHYIFNKYEDSIHIVLGTLKDEKENNSGEIGEEVFQKAKLIIDKFGRAVKEKQQEIKHVEELQKEAVSKSLIGRLDSEIEYMEKYLETDLYGKETIA